MRSNVPDKESFHSELNEVILLFPYKAITRGYLSVVFILIAYIFCACIYVVCIVSKFVHV